MERTGVPVASNRAIVLGLIKAVEANEAAIKEIEGQIAELQEEMLEFSEENDRLREQIAEKAGLHATDRRVAGVSTPTDVYLVGLQRGSNAVVISKIDSIS